MKLKTYNMDGNNNDFPSEFLLCLKDHHWLMLTHLIIISHMS